MEPLTHGQIETIIINEIKARTVTTVNQCHTRIEDLCNNHGQAHNMYSIALMFGVA